MKYFIATVSSKGQFTIPKAIREQLGIKPGDKVAVTVTHGAMLLTPMSTCVAETADSRAPHIQRRR